MNEYTLELENDQLLNIIPLVKFLKENEGTDITLIVNQESHCLDSCGVYRLLDQFKFSNVNILTANAIEQSNNYNIKYPYNWFHWLCRINGFDHSINYSWNGSKIFGCFYGRPAANRLGIASHLATMHSDKSLLCLRFNISDEDFRKHFEIQKLFSWDGECLEKLTKLIKQLDKYTSTSNYHAYSYTTFDYDFSNPINHLYKDIFVDLVSEANLEGNSFYPTEKIARAILCKKPFIVMAPKYYLMYLRQMGFKTFNTVWSESYDNLGENLRYFAVLELIDWLAKQPIDELQRQIQDIVEHNYQLLVNQQFNTKITRYE